MTQPADGAATAAEGAAAEAIRAAETALARQNTVTAHVDLEVITAVLNAHTAHADGAGALESLKVDIEAAVLSRPGLDTPAGAREFQRYLIDTLHDIRSVVERTDLDDTSKAALAAALASLYASSEPGPAAVSAATGLPEPAFGDLTGLPEPAPFGDEPYPAEPYPAEPVPAPVAAGPAQPSPPPVPAAAMPAIPALPSLGGAPGLGPLGGLSTLPAWTGGGRDEPGTGRDEPPPEPPTDDAATDDAATDDAAPDDAAQADPWTEVIADAVSGTPIPDAFAQQGVDIPDPGTPVGAPLDPGEVVPGDIALFDDRHALALGNGRALLDDQIQPIETVNRPGFLGWQHPPEPEPTPAPDR